MESLNISGNHFSSYYTKNPNVKPNYDFKTLSHQIFKDKDRISAMIQRMFRSQDEDTFRDLISALPEEVQEILLEATVLAKVKDIKKGKENRDKIYAYFEAYITRVGDMWISSLRGDDDIYRCLKKGKWKDCTTIDIDKLGQQKEDVLKKLVGNKYGFYGTYNSVNQKFCISDARGQEGVEDKRKLRPGKVCDSWPIGDLVPVVVNILKVPYPKSFLKDSSKKQLIDKCVKGNAGKYNTAFQKDKLSKLDETHLRRGIYWGLGSKFGGKRNKKNLCDAVRKWFDKNELLILDSRCGIQNKKKTIGTKEKTKKPVSKKASALRIVPDEEANRFEAIYPQLKKLFNECAKEDSFEGGKDYKKYPWFIIYLKGKILGVIVTGPDKRIVYICVKRHYRTNRKDVVKDALVEAFNTIYSPSEQIAIIVENKSKKFNAFKKLYTELGFSEAASVEGTKTKFVFRRK